jgi:hypothetical protein
MEQIVPVPLFQSHYTGDSFLISRGYCEVVPQILIISQVDLDLGGRLEALLL